MGVEAEQRRQMADGIRQNHRKDAQHQRIVLAIVVVVGVLATASFLMWTQLRPSLGEGAAAVVAPANATDDYGFTLTSDVASDGEQSSTGPVEVKIYEDFLCPSCKVFFEESGGFLDEQVAAGSISLTYYPIAFLVTASSDEYSQRASNAAVCVGDQAGVAAYASMHALLMQNQPEQGGAGLTDEQLIAYGSEAGAADITECVTDRTFEPWLEQALKEAQRLDVTGTPTVRIDDVNIVKSDNGQESIPGPDELAFAIEAAQ